MNQNKKSTQKQEPKKQVVGGRKRFFEQIAYRTAIGAYSLALKLASPFNTKAKAMVQGRKEAFATLKRARKKKAGERFIWVHAASLGEFEQGRPLMELIKRRNPEIRILLTFFSPSGYQVRKDWDGADVVIYLPADSPKNARRLLSIAKPEMAIFVKYEIWRNYLSELKSRGIPAYLISAAFRKNQLFFRPYGGWYREWLRCFRHIYVQDQGSRELLAGIGINNCTVAGDTRFDRVTDIMHKVHPIEPLERMLRGWKGPVGIFGSSWSADEAIYVPWLRRNAGRVKSVIAPHEFDAARLETLKRALGPSLQVVLLTEVKRNPQLAADADVLILDCFGLLSSAYRYGTFAYVGGGFGAGIHNLNEAAVYSIPVVFGPKHQKFIEARELIEAGGGFCINSSNSANTVLSGFIADPDQTRESGQKAGAYIHSKLGATSRIAAGLFPAGKPAAGLSASRKE